MEEKFQQIHISCERLRKSYLTGGEMTAEDHLDQQVLFNLMNEVGFSKGKVYDMIFGNAPHTSLAYIIKSGGSYVLTQDMVFQLPLMTSNRCDAAIFTAADAMRMKLLLEGEGLVVELIEVTQ